MVQVLFLIDHQKLWKFEEPFVFISLIDKTRNKTTHLIKVWEFQMCLEKRRTCQVSERGWDTYYVWKGVGFIVHLKEVVFLLCLKVDEIPGVSWRKCYSWYICTRCLWWGRLSWIDLLLPGFSRNGELQKLNRNCASQTYLEVTVNILAVTCP